jgi:hypothetical protein
MRAPISICRRLLPFALRILLIDLSFGNRDDRAEQVVDLLKLVQPVAAGG